MDGGHIRFRCGTASSHRLEQLLQLCAHAAIFLTAQIATQLHRHIECPYPGAAIPEGFTDETLSAVTINRAGGGFLSGDHTEPRMESRVGARARNEIAAGYSQARFKNGFEFPWPP